MWENDIRKPSTSCFGGIVDAPTATYMYECNWDQDVFAVSMAGDGDVVVDKKNAVILREALDAFIEGRE